MLRSVNVIHFNYSLAIKKEKYNYGLTIYAFIRLCHLQFRIWALRFLQLYLRPTSMRDLSSMISVLHFKVNVAHATSNPFYKDDRSVDAGDFQLFYVVRISLHILTKL